MATVTTSPYSASWNTTAVTNGAHTIKAVARDAAGNTTTSTRTVTVDNAKPVVSLSAPGGGGPVSGTVTLSATASDNVGVTDVRFSVDNTALATDATSPYSASWNTTGVSNGIHTLSAVARDAAGNTTTSTRSVTVANPDITAPSVSLTGLANGATVSGAVPLSANASDNIGVVGVQFYVDGTAVGGDDTSAPYSASWNTVAVANGSYVLTARARDAAGNVTMSAPVTVTVANPDITAPTVSLSAPSGPVSGAVSLSATATDNVGVTGVQFLVDGNPIGAEDSSSPYGVSFNTATVANGTHTVTAHARDAAGNTTLSAPVSITVANDLSNHAPVASPSLFSYDPLTGVVTGSVNGTDVDGNPLIYDVTGAPTRGVISVNGRTGSYVYTPTQVARLAADQTAASDSDTFTVTVSDGQTSTSTVVTVPISPAKLSVSQTATRVGAGANGIAFRGNYALVANKGAGTVSVIDTTTDQVIATVPVGSAPTSVATTYNGTFAFVANQGSNTVTVVNTYDNTFYKTIDVGAQPTGIVQATTATQTSPGNWTRAVYVTNSGSNTVSVIETLTDTVAGTIPVGGNPTGVAVSPDGTRVYVANKASNTVSVIDAEGKVVVATVPVGTNPVGVAVNSTGTRLYVTNLNGTVSVVNTTTPTPTVVATVAVGPQPYGVALSSDGAVYVANSDDTITVIDGATNTVVRTLAVDTAPEIGTHYLAVDPYGRVYITDAADGMVRSVSTRPSEPSTISATSTVITVGANPTAVAVNGSHTYVLTSGNRAISVIDSTTKQVVKTIPLSTAASGMVVSADDSRIYLLGYDTVSVIDASTGSEVVTPISIPDLCDGYCWAGGLYDLAISPDGSRVYALRGYASEGGNSSAVSIIDVATNSVTTTSGSDYLYDIQTSSNGTQLYAAFGESYWSTLPYVMVFDAATLSGQAAILVSTAQSTGTEFATGEFATAVVPSPDGNRAYAIVSSSTPKYVAVIDTNAASPTYNKQIGQIAVPHGVESVAVSPDSRRLYVSLSDGRTVEVIDAASNTVLGYFTKPTSGPMTVAPDGTLYFTDYANGKVYVVTVGQPTQM